MAALTRPSVRIPTSAWSPPYSRPCSSPLRRRACLHRLLRRDLDPFLCRRPPLRLIFVREPASLSSAMLMAMHSGGVAQLSGPNVHLFFGGTASRPPGWDIRCSAYFRSYASTGSIDQPEEHSSLLFFLRRACTDHDAAVRVRAMCPPAGGAAGCASTRVRRRAEGGGQSTPGYRDETASSNGAVGDKQNDGRRHSQGGRCFFF